MENYSSLKVLTGISKNKMSDIVKVVYRILLHDDSAIKEDDCMKYGYNCFKDGARFMYPINQKEALKLYIKNSGESIYKLYEDNSESMVENIHDILEFKGIFGFESHN
ncbi:hypothetical protein MKA27_19835 [[Clostridium] innocuum]|uniref:hypothetical protein n=1 Tax=Clostridium innocuum TaxID=1522 RepID=UPI000D6CECF2|nr:hypothetical protein [[Clostridium] innocuum]MCR0316651.1 hypothetical protein [[Clostridium] innocuum]MCR0371726.1 hypothetical protein [[Clostridium] innocuum]MCR0376042.1 hypothetical protein [[Clostridium] innocuum]MCR0561312.1 hypothetical protein [[Clostridium] innocuum]MCR0604364.1 hypothetical protein [[Clostridium] innocuum]